MNENNTYLSFSIAKKYLNDNQIYKIWNHIDEARNHMNYYDFECVNDDDSWQIIEDECYIEGSCLYENFDMRTYLIDYLRVSETIIDWNY